MENEDKIYKKIPGYVCPLCPDHEDYIFVWSPTLETYICDGCEIDLHQEILFDEARNPESFILNLFEKHTDLTFDEYRLIELDDIIKWFEKSHGKEHRSDQLDYYRKEAARLKSLLHKEEAND